MQDFELAILGKLIQTEKLKYNECGWDSQHNVLSFLSILKSQLSSHLEDNAI